MLHELIISPRTRWRKMHRRKQMAAIFVVQPKRRFMGGPIKRSINSLSRWSDMAKMHNYSPFFRSYIPLIRLLWDITDVTTESPAWPVLLNEPHGSGENSRSSLAPATVEGCWGKPSRKWCRPEIFNPTMTRQWENDGWQGTNKIHHHHGHYHLAESNVKYADVHTCLQCRDIPSQGAKRNTKAATRGGGSSKENPFPGARQCTGLYSVPVIIDHPEMAARCQDLSLFFSPNETMKKHSPRIIHFSCVGRQWCTTNVETWSTTGTVKSYIIATASFQYFASNWFSADTNVVHH